MNAELTNTRKRTRLDRKFDRLRDAEEAGKLGKSKTSRCPEERSARGYRRRNKRW